MSAYLRPLIWLAGAVLVGFLVYLALFTSGVGGGIPVLFYRGLVLALAAGLVVGLGMVRLTRGRGDPTLAIAAAATSIAFNTCFLVLLPVTIDRSISVFLLATIERADGATADELEGAFIDGYVRDMAAIDRRVKEQAISGNIVVGPDGRVRLTTQGRRFMLLSRSVAGTFDTDQRFVEGAPARR